MDRPVLERRCSLERSLVVAVRKGGRFVRHISPSSNCTADARSTAFFMRKGADCLSKWVGEAERQLRLLFEEAKACQPSIIFFDEIDGQSFPPFIVLR